MLWRLTNCRIIIIIINGYVRLRGYKRRRAVTFCAVIVAENPTLLCT